MEEVRRRLAAIRIDGILESGYIEEFIEDNSWSIYPQLERTERPDKVTAGLLEGRVAIVTQNTPFVLLLPTVVFQFLHSPEDYYERPFIAAALRLMRLANLIVSLLGPSLYVAVLSYHQAMLPSPLDLTISAARQGLCASPSDGGLSIPAFSGGLLRKAFYRRRPAFDAPGQLDCFF
ncbi:MAG: spore germination protein, partial [Firmicutes bacterium]|nr:spore germination protein [Bacillota bacterium]